MIVFELTFPNRGSWDGKWSGEKDRHIIVKKDFQVPKDRVGKSYYYDFGDGWGASISVRKMNGNDSKYRQLKKKNVGFCGYDWMIDSIIVYDEIVYKKE